MDYQKITRVSFDSLLVHKFRTFLTMLGIIFGVAAVIAMLSIGEGARQDALEQIELLGVRNIIIEGTVPAESKGSDETGGRSPGLTMADADNLAMFDNVFERVVPTQITEGIKAYYADAETDIRAIGVTPEYFSVMKLAIKDGTFLRPDDDAEQNQVCVISADVKRNLFAFADPIGKIIKVEDLFCTIIGVVQEKATAGAKIEGLEVGNVNANVYLPLSTSAKKMNRETDYAAARSGQGSDARRRYNEDELDQIILQVLPDQNVGQAASLVNRVMQRRHREVPDFSVIVPEALLAQSQKTQRIFNIVMGAIAGISLLVGGIGIMNIMLASVLERTREIGVRRAVGASRKDILSQFLIEAVTICLIGCFIGVFCGLALAKTISSYADWRTVISVFSIFLAVGVSAAVGIIFGYFPARKAASLDPIEALRYE